jgi:hypothetical protein
MESKTVQTLKVGQVLYEPTVKYIIENRIKEIRSTNEGYQFDVGIGRRDLATVILNHPSSTKVDVYKYYTNDNILTLFINEEKAIEIQRKMQFQMLKELQGKANIALQELNDFTLKYF